MRKSIIFQISNPKSENPIWRPIILKRRSSNVRLRFEHVLTQTKHQGNVDGLNVN